MARKPAGSTIESPPYISLDDALHVATEIQERGGGTLALESLAEVFGNSRRSSSFERKLSAIKNFGLADRDGERIRLSQLGLMYVAPTTPGERARAKATVMRNIALLQQLHDRFAGGVLPPPESLANLILREYGAPDPLNRAWADFFTASIRSADLLGSVGGRTTVRQLPDGDEAVAAEGPTPEDQPTRREIRPTATAMGADAAIGQRDVQRLEVPLHDGSVAAVLLPRIADPNDIGDIIALLEVMKRRAERQGGPNGPQE